MHAFTTLWRVADGTPARLHVTCEDEGDAVVAPADLPALQEAQRALGPPFDALPLRLPVSPASLAAFADAARSMPVPGPRDAPTELGLVPWAPSWTDHVSPRLWRRLADHGFRITQLAFGTGYSSMAGWMTLPVHKLEVDGSRFGPGDDHRDGEDGAGDVPEDPALRSLCTLARARGLALVAGAGASAWPRARLAALGFEEVVGDGWASSPWAGPPWDGDPALSDAPSPGSAPPRRAPAP